MADAYTDTLIRLNPCFATTLGMPGHETEYPDYSPAGIAGSPQRKPGRPSRPWRAWNPQDDVDAVTLDAMRERLGLQLEIHESGWDWPT